MNKQTGQMSEGRMWLPVRARATAAAAAAFAAPMDSASGEKIGRSV